MIALPYRHGGLGIRNPAETADVEYNTSVEITSELAQLICRQETNLALLDMDKVKQKKSELRADKEKSFINEAEEIETFLDEKSRKMFKCAQEKGSSAWLSSLPIKRLGYVINKQEFRDAVCLRYGWTIPETPAYCGCGAKNSMDHILICKKGGYVSMRHNALRDVEAKLLQEVCRDVKVEPCLIPTDEEQTQGNTTTKSKLDYLHKDYGVSTRRPSWMYV